jgi:hypothetical protein
MPVMNEILCTPNYFARADKKSAASERVRF